MRPSPPQRPSGQWGAKIIVPQNQAERSFAIGLRSTQDSPAQVPEGPATNFLNRQLPGWRRMLEEVAREKVQKTYVRDKGEQPYKDGFARAAGVPLPVYFNPNIESVSTIDVPREDTHRMAAIDEAASRGKTLVYVQVSGSLVPKRELGYRAGSEYRGWAENPNVVWQIPVEIDANQPLTREALADKLDPLFNVPVTADGMRQVAEQLPTSRLMLMGEGNPGLEDRKSKGGPESVGEYWQLIQLDFINPQQVMTNQWFVRTRERGFFLRLYEQQDVFRHSYEPTTRTSLNLDNEMAKTDIERLTLGDVKGVETPIGERRSIGRRYQFDVDLDFNLLSGTGSQLEVGFGIGQRLLHPNDDDIKNDRLMQHVIQAVRTQPGQTVRVVEASAIVPMKAQPGFRVGGVGIHGPFRVDDWAKVTVRYPIVSDGAGGFSEQARQLMQDAKRSMRALARGGMATLEDPANFRISDSIPNPTGTRLEIERVTQRDARAGAGAGIDIDLPLDVELDVGIGATVHVGKGQLRAKKVSLQWRTGGLVQTQVETSEFHPTRGYEFKIDLDPEPDDDGFDGTATKGAVDLVLQVFSGFFGTETKFHRRGRWGEREKQTIADLNPSDPAVARAIENIVNDQSIKNVDSVRQTRSELKDLQRHGRVLLENAETSNHVNAGTDVSVLGFEVKRRFNISEEQGILITPESTHDYNRVNSGEERSANHDLLFGNRPLFEDENTRIFLDHLAPVESMDPTPSHFLLRVEYNMEDPSTSTEEIGSIMAMLTQLQAKGVAEISAPRRGLSRIGFTDRGDHGYTRQNIQATFDLHALSASLESQRGEFVRQIRENRPELNEGQINAMANHAMENFARASYLRAVARGDAEFEPLPDHQVERALAFHEWYAALRIARHRNRFEVEPLSDPNLWLPRWLKGSIRKTSGGWRVTGEVEDLLRGLRSEYRKNFRTAAGKKRDLGDDSRYYMQADAFGEMMGKLRPADLDPMQMQAQMPAWKSIVDTMRAGTQKAPFKDSLVMWRVLTAFADLSENAVPHYDVLVQGKDAFIRAQDGVRPSLSGDIQRAAERRTN